ncbi:lipopolysaccharide transport periplasmic protein LptA [Acinetobacter rudis]|uniref:Lipopolysaccharide export system protein LptA n=1 Tax=Acinetobacter rudis TaxID=632955 RepID=A0AAW8JBB3_9GAMM|nr:lipopolysaccharide transport periplasmic protein LptA [Acinetobacter rudis]MDQ8936968.1 lipopolysaccharide transport periplasmic protein LptA [Acinetobacter rudis]MDQ8953158.1 lipopolysaccharide transport periplasmic protein LptA [Acinetobacter rudis]MDQ9019188.1 lipopolysaccharide transport periplasmic protein LptA [Acinetobacter rudis]
MQHNNHFTILTRLSQKSVLVAALACASASVFALQSDRNQPISLVADHATFNDKTGLTTYSGNVVIEQGTMKVQANSIVAQLNANKQVSVVTATGSPAKFQQQMDGNKGLVRGEAQKIIYNAETGILNMSGNAYLDQNGASIRSSTLKYSMNKGDVEANGGAGSGQSNGGRVKIVIPPSTNKTFPGARD